jgi:hypothetical protein
MRIAARLAGVMLVPALVCGAAGAAPPPAPEGGPGRYRFPGERVGGIAFDGRGGIWLAEGGRSETSTRIYRLDRHGKLVKTIDVPEKWICALAYGGGCLWATNGKVVKIDPADGKVLMKREIKPPTERTGLAFVGEQLLCSTCKRIECVVGAGPKAKRGKYGAPVWSGAKLPERSLAGSLAFDGGGLWMLAHDYAMMFRLGPEGATAEKGLVIPEELEGHRIEDMDWDGKAFWVSLTKRLGISKYDSAVIRVDTVDYRLDSEIPRVKVRINRGFKGSLVLQRTTGSPWPRHFRSAPPPPEPEREPEGKGPGPDLELGEYSVPEGEYRVLEYARFKTDERNFEWRVKVVNWGTLNVKAGGEGRIPEFRIADGLRGRLELRPPSMRWQQGRYSLHFSIVDRTGCKVQLRRVLKTPAAGFEMRDKNGQKIGKGLFSAGIDSYCGYHLRIPGHAELPLTVELSLDSGPFDVRVEDVVIEELP